MSHPNSHKVPNRSEQIRRVMVSHPNYTQKQVYQEVIDRGYSVSQQLVNIIWRKVKGYTGKQRKLVAAVQSIAESATCIKGLAGQLKGLGNGNLANGEKVIILVSVLAEKYGGITQLAAAVADLNTVRESLAA